MFTMISPHFIYKKLDESIEAYDKAGGYKLWRMKYLIIELRSI